MIDKSAATAAVAVADIFDGAYVDLGISIPELVAGFLPEGRESVYHPENGLLGMEPPPGVTFELAQQQTAAPILPLKH